MKCPRCETTMLDERERDGVTVDVCTQCRGLWLDRGELEKLISRATRDLDELEQQSRAPQQPPPRPEPRHEPAYDPHQARSRRDSDHGHSDSRYGHPRRKKSFMEQLGDIFD
jgi:uncharacterized protein